MGPKSHHNLPSESTTALETEDAIKTSTCQIWIQEGASIPSKDVSRMRMEFHYAPYRSVQMKLQDMVLEKIEEPINCCIVYIRSFTDSGHDFVYCVSDRTHLAKFYGGTYGASDYQGPIFAALVVLAGAVIERVGPINWRNYAKVPKHIENVNGVRWRYLFATARRAWSTMSFEASHVPILEEMVADVPVQQQSPEPEARLPDAISGSKYPPEAQRIAIHQNVEVLKKKPDHHDRIFKYLEIELSGRSNFQGKDELTKQQYRLVERLRDNADDFDILYTDEDENGNEIRNADVDKEEEAQLISERDAIIQQILEQLALPITVRDDPDDSDLPDSMEVMGLETDLIQKLANFTGATPHQCERYLTTANWNIDLALSYFEEEQARSRPSVVRNTSTPGPKDLIERVTTFKGLTNAESAVASSYLNDAGWDLSRAVSKFFDDAEAPENNSKGVDESPNVLASKFDAKTSEQPVRQVPPYSDATTGPAGECAILDSNLKASIQRRIAELDTEITQLDKQLEEMDEDDLDMIMRDIDESEKVSNEDSGLYTGPRGKLRVVNEDPSPVVTRREGMSHAGLPCVLDEAGNVVSYKRPTGTPYQQYLAMRLRLQVQNYGHEVVPSDEDPHRGIPTRERYPESLVQEVVSDSSSSSDDNIIPPNSTDLPTSQEFAHKTAQAERRRVAMKEMVELMELIAGSQNAEATRSMEEVAAADALTRLKNQQGSDWAEQAGQAIQHVKWQDIVVSNQIDQDNFLFGNEDEHDKDAVSTEDADQEKPARIKPALRDTAQPRRPSMRVRFNLSDEERNAPTTWDERSEDAEEKMPMRGRPILRGTRRSERLRMKALANAAENGKDKTGTRDDHTNVSLSEEVEKEMVTTDSRAEGENDKPEEEKEKSEAQKEDAEAQKKRDLFVSKREDAWDGLGSDEGELELGSDVDAEGEEEEIEERQEEEVEEQRAGQVKVQQEKYKCPPRVDEKMEG